MCHDVIDQQVVNAVKSDNQNVLADVRRMVRDDAYTPEDPHELAGLTLVHTRLVTSYTIPFVRTHLLHGLHGNHKLEHRNARACSSLG